MNEFDPDPIVDEVRRARDAYAARFNYDLRAIFRDLKEQERNSGRTYVSFADERTESKQEAVLNKPQQPTGPTPSVSDSIPSPQASSVPAR